MNSRRLAAWLQTEARRTQVRGNGDLVGDFVQLEQLLGDGDHERYLDGMQRFIDAARARAEEVWMVIGQYCVGRTLAYPLDRPGAALPILVDLNARTARGPLQGTAFDSCARLELLRAYHKIDAPGFRVPILQGLLEIWPRLKGDAGPASEWFDLWWRTGFWCKDPGVMQQGFERLREGPTEIEAHALFWKTRMLHLSGELAAAESLLEELLRAQPYQEDDAEVWQMYLLVERCDVLREMGRHEDARTRLDAVEARVHAARDPMLEWDHARAGAQLYRAVGNHSREAAEWRRAVAVVESLGTQRLHAEFLVELVAAEIAAKRLQEARDSSRRAFEVMKGLRSRADLEQRLAGMQALLGG